jgi:hypothetical protein
MGWGAVWHAASVQFGAEPVEVRLAVFVATAFALLMILIGLRHAFHAAGPAHDSDGLASDVLPELPKRVFAAPPPAAVALPVAQPFRARKPLPRVVRKSAKRTINRQRAARPQIRRARLTLHPEIDA